VTGFPEFPNSALNFKSFFGYDVLTWEIQCHTR
jgi:hypothetical protein